MTSALDNPRWIALGTVRQDELLGAYRYTNVDGGYDWWDCTYEHFIETLQEAGLEVATREVQFPSGRTRREPKIYFSGFSSQGDGAVFEAEVSDWPKFLALIGKAQWAGHAAENSWSFFSSNSRGMCMEFSAELNVEENPYDEDDEPLQHTAWAIRHPQPSESELDELQTECEGKFNDLASGLYRDLEEEHDHLTSDETVVDYILEHCEAELTKDEEETA